MLNYRNCTSTSGALREAGRRLEYEPELQGKPLADELVGYRSVRAVGQRYRIIYKVENELVIVIVVAVGIRREGDRSDIYRIAARLMRSGLMTL